ncbi:MAG: hypothetical protein ABR956_11020 [Terracidiphilus sp.]|jgi:uncharacterized membrane protein
MDKQPLTRQDWLVLARIGFTAAVLAIAAIVILTNNYPDAHIKWAFGVVGVILGYWLK